MNAPFLLRMRKAVLIAKGRGAVLNGEAAIAQAALESGWGLSYLTRKANNLFGIKSGRSWVGPTLDLPTLEYRAGKYVRELAQWRSYASYNKCLVDYAHLIAKLPWFSDALPHADPPLGDGDAEQWVAHLVDRDTPGELAWATGPRYVEKVMRIAEEIFRHESEEEEEA